MSMHTFNIAPFSLKLERYLVSREVTKKVEKAMCMKLSGRSLPLAGYQPCDAWSSSNVGQAPIKLAVTQSLSKSEPLHQPISAS